MSFDITGTVKAMLNKEFWDTNGLTDLEIAKILAKYKSPLLGEGLQKLINKLRSTGVNPGILLAMTIGECQLATGEAHPKYIIGYDYDGFAGIVTPWYKEGTVNYPETYKNPWCVVANVSGWEQSLDVAVATLKAGAKQNSSNPFDGAMARYNPENYGNYIAGVYSTTVKK